MVKCVEIFWIKLKSDKLIMKFGPGRLT